MKITKEKLKELIKEEFDNWGAPQLTPEQEKVSSMIDALIGAIDEMGESNPDMTDIYIALFRALSRAGLNVKAVASMA
jgi:hypothetical protein